jgi:hypothetical protein
MTRLLLRSRLILIPLWILSLLTMVSNLAYASIGLSTHLTQKIQEERKNYLLEEHRLISHQTQKTSLLIQQNLLISPEQSFSFQLSYYQQAKTNLPRKNSRGFSDLVVSWTHHPITATIDSSPDIELELFVSPKTGTSRISSLEKSGTHFRGSHAWGGHMGLKIVSGPWQLEGKPFLIHYLKEKQLYLKDYSWLILNPRTYLGIGSKVQYQFHSQWFAGASLGVERSSAYKAYSAELPLSLYPQVVQTRGLFIQYQTKAMGSLNKIGLTYEHKKSKQDLTIPSTSFLTKIRSSQEAWNLQTYWIF